VIPVAQDGNDQAATMLEKLFAAAQPGAVDGQPVESGTYTVIAAAEVTSGGGFGMGVGLGPAPRSDETVEAAPPESRETAETVGAAGPWDDRSRSSPSARTA
jgi:hypothetical protein